MSTLHALLISEVPYSSPFNNPYHHTPDFVAEKPSKYCDSEDDDGTTAEEACPFTCGNCGCQVSEPTEMLRAPSVRGLGPHAAAKAQSPLTQDSYTWRYKGKSSKDCDWVSKKPADRCLFESDEDVLASEGCRKTCGSCGCQDSYTWRYKGKSSKDCTWVAKKPNKRCGKKDEDGTKAKKACLASCETCESS